MTSSLTDAKIVHSDHGVIGIDELAMRARIGGILNRRPAVGLEVGVVRNGSLEFSYGHGVADIASNTTGALGALAVATTATAVRRRRVRRSRL